MSNQRLHNFSAGPAVLPLEVLEAVSENLLSYKDNGRNTGLGIMEFSHRSKEFEAILDTTKSNFRELLAIGDDFEILFTTGGASNQFSMVPMNLLGNGGVANYLITGTWAKNAFKEATKFGQTHVACSSEDRSHTYIPEKCDLTPNPAYVHFTSNNTIFGTQFASEPEVGDAPLVCDASSDLMHKKIPMDKYGLVYAGAQKNLGPSGVTIVIIRKSLLERSPKNLPVMMNYNTYAANNSLYNTPPTLPIYVVGEVLKWIKKSGGLESMEAQNRKKAALLYKTIDDSSFYSCPVDKNSRSIMNVVYRLPSTDLEDLFVKQSQQAGLIGLKGHRSAGGIRASIYNACPPESVAALVDFMKDFEAKNG